MKTNVSIKFNSIEEYREIERVLEVLGYYNYKDWNESELVKYKKGFVSIDDRPTNGRYVISFEIFDFVLEEKVYNSLEAFLKD